MQTWEFQNWVNTILRYPGNMASTAVEPKLIAEHDKRAAELVQKVRTARDELTSYLKSRSEGERCLRKQS